LPIDTVMDTLADRFDPEYYLAWMKSNWTLSFYISAIYVILVFYGQSVMKTRPAFSLRPQLFIWSLCLAMFSIWGSYRGFLAIWSDAMENGWLYTMCSLSYYTTTGPGTNTAFWSAMFIFSKLPELGDTVFIVLRKQRLIFLHWYHHITVFIYCWYSYGHPVATGRWFTAINYTVHGIMYSYYALRATGRRTPGFIPKFITTVQILQMVAGIFVNIKALTMLYKGESCYVGITNIVVSLIMYSSYFVLFCNFFIQTYVNKKKKIAEATSTKETETITEEPVRQTVTKRQSLLTHRTPVTQEG